MKYTVEFIKNEDDVVVMELYGSPQNKLETANMIVEILEEMTLYSLENTGFVFKKLTDDLELNIEVSEDDSDNSLNIKLEGVDFNTDYSAVSTIIVGLHNTLTLLSQQGLEVDALFKDVAVMS